MVDRDGASPKKDEGQGDSGGGEGKFIAGTIRGPDESIVQVHLPDCDDEIAAHKESGSPSKESCQQQEATEELGEGGDIAQPGWQPKAGDELSMVVQATEDLVIAVCHHDETQSEAHHEKSKRLKAIEISQSVPPKRKNKITAGQRLRGRRPIPRKQLRPLRRFGNVAPPQDACSGTFVSLAVGSLSALSRGR